MENECTVMIILSEVDDVKEALIKKLCSNNSELKSYMSRTFPEKNDVLIWNVVTYENTYIGHVWIEKYSKVIKGHKLGIVLWEDSKRGQGIGFRTISKIIDNYIDAGFVKPIFLNVRENNERAIRCYIKVGFTVLKKSEKKVGNQNISFLQMIYRI